MSSLRSSQGLRHVCLQLLLPLHLTLGGNREQMPLLQGPLFKHNPQSTWSSRPWGYKSGPERRRGLAGQNPASISHTRAQPGTFHSRVLFACTTRVQVSLATASGAQGFNCCCLFCRGWTQMVQSTMAAVMMKIPWMWWSAWSVAVGTTNHTSSCATVRVKVILVSSPRAFIRCAGSQRSV